MVSHLPALPRLFAAPPERRHSIRRLVAFAAASAIAAPLGALVQGARFVDRWLYPNAFNFSPQAPVFIVATPRSGTTFLHHLLALDTANFSHFRLYQTIFPSVVINRAVGFFSEHLAEAPIVSRMIARFNRVLFPAWRGIHSVGLASEEEDESLFVYALHTPAVYLLNPYADAVFRSLDRAPSSFRSRIARDYRRTVQRHLFAENATTKRMLVKNCLVASRLETTLEAFPDARFIHLVRDPVVAIPSAVSLFFSAWRAHSPEIPRDGVETRALATMFIEHYRRLCAFSEKMGPGLGRDADSDPDPNAEAGRCLTVRYEDLIDRPIALVKKIYAFLGLDFNETTLRCLEEEVSDSGGFKSRHHYSLEEFGLDADEIRTQLAMVLPGLGYCSPPGPASGLASMSEGT